MFVVVWQFEIAEEKVAAFEAAYGPEGSWAQLFRTSPDYIGTELLRDVENPGRYFVIDRWESADAYNAFAAEHRDEYMRRVDDTRFHYEVELRFGTFETVWHE